MEINFLIKVLTVIIVANILPLIIIIPAFTLKFIPRWVAVPAIPTLIFISSKVRNVLGFEPEVNRVANYVAGIIIILLIFLSERYKWLDPKKENDGSMEP